LRCTIGASRTRLGISDLTARWSREVGDDYVRGELVREHAQRHLAAATEDDSPAGLMQRGATPAGPSVSREHLGHSVDRRPGGTPSYDSAGVRDLNEIIAKAILGKP
jgi:hypothetical protein